VRQGGATYIDLGCAVTISLMGERAAGRRLAYTENASMGLMDKALGKARPAKPEAAKGAELVDIACDLLATQIDLGGASLGNGNRGRLEEPFARGYVFGFIDALLQKGGIADETHALALLTVAHGNLFGQPMGVLFITDALADQSPDSVFTKGRGVGASDLIRWLNENSTTSGPPLLLTDYLNGAK
jgi:hypothetical protein